GRSPVELRLATGWVCVLDFLDPGSECKAQDSIRVAGLVEPRNLLERIPLEDVLDRRVIEGRGSRGGRPHSGQTSVIGSGVDQRTYAISGGSERLLAIALRHAVVPRVRTTDCSFERLCI